MTKAKTIAMRQEKLKQAFVDQLKRTPIIETACQKTGIPRTNVYRWQRENKKFAKAVLEALHEGRTVMSDVAESQLFKLIAQEEYKAIALYLGTHNPRYAKKLELSGSVETREAPLSREQKKRIQEALRLSSIGRHADKRKKKE